MRFFNLLVLIWTSIIHVQRILSMEFCYNFESCRHSTLSKDEMQCFGQLFSNDIGKHDLMSNCWLIQHFHIFAMIWRCETSTKSWCANNLTLNHVFPEDNWWNFHFEKSNLIQDFNTFWQNSIVHSAAHYVSTIWHQIVFSDHTWRRMVKFSFWYIVTTCFLRSTGRQQSLARLRVGRVSILVGQLTVT